MPTHARDLMQADPITVLPSTPFLQVQHLVVVAQISGVPVVDEQGKVLGVISVGDLLRVVDQACDDEIDDAPTVEHQRSPDSEELSEQLGALTALDVASPDIVWVSPDTPITRIAHLMRTAEIHRVLVGIDGHLSGILTAFDLLAAIEERAPPSSRSDVTA